MHFYFFIIQVGDGEGVKMKLEFEWYICIVAISTTQTSLIYKMLHIFFDTNNYSIIYLINFYTILRRITGTKGGDRTKKCGIRKCFNNSLLQLLSTGVF